MQRPKSMVRAKPGPEHTAIAPVVEPAFITEKNAFAVIGQLFSWCIDRCPEIDCPVVYAGRKRLIPYRRFVVALEAHGVRRAGRDAATDDAPDSGEQPSVEPDWDDQDALRRRLTRQP